MKNKVSKPAMGLFIIGEVEKREDYIFEEEP